MSLSRHRATHAKVVGRMPASLGGEYVVHTDAGAEKLASARKLSRVPVADRDGVFIGWEDEGAA